MKPSGIGGMAVMEGVMMKNKESYAVAVRKPNNEIVVEKGIHKDLSDKLKFFKLPVLRGILAFVDSMVLGIKVLNYSASFFEEEEKEDGKKKVKKDKKEKKTSDIDIEEISATIEEEIEREEAIKKEERANALMMLSAVFFSILLSIALFMVLPVLLSSIFRNFTKSNAMINLLEGMIRFIIFIGYVYLASRLKEIKRVFMYHGAEHKAINCIENGLELTLENVRKQTKVHKRCGTSFTLLVILISLVFFMIIPVHGLLLKIISRIIFVPFIAGVSYEFIRLAGRSQNRVVEIISKPGLWMQGLTTKEPDDSMIEVAIQSVDGVFDWKSFVEASKEEEEATATVEMEDEKEKVIEEESKPKAKSKSERPVKSAALNRTIPSSVSKKTEKEEEEDDEILKALDKFFDENKN